MQERKCPKCGKWNESHYDNCRSCGELINEKIKRENEKAILEEKKKLTERIQKPDWLTQFFEKAEKEGNFFHKTMAGLLRTMWAIYFGIMLFIMWFIFWAAG